MSINNPDTNNHPLTEERAAEMWDAHREPGVVPFHEQGRLYKRGQTAMLRAAFNAGREHERANPDDDRPWEPLNGRPVRAGYEVRQERAGITITGVVARVDKDGDPWAAEDDFIGRLGTGTWYVRRPVEDLPTGHGTVIVPADGHEYIEATGPVSGATWRTKEAVLGSDGRWYGVWRPDVRLGGLPAAHVGPEHITPNTRKVEDR